MNKGSTRPSHLCSWTHLFVAEHNSAVTVQSCLEGEAALVLPALEVDMVPLNNKDCSCGGEQRPG